MVPPLPPINGAYFAMSSSSLIGILDFMDQ